MLTNTLFNLVNTAGGLSVRSDIWRDHVRETPGSTAGLRRRDARVQSLSDAAEQLRRLTRYAELQDAPARLLANALAIIERESAAQAGAAQR